jgi:hypothetical protein
MTSRGSAESPPGPSAARVGSPQDWVEPPLDAQCAMPLRIRHFVTWLIVTQRVAAVPTTCRVR